MIRYVNFHSYFSNVSSYHDNMYGDVSIFIIVITEMNLANSYLQPSYSLDKASRRTKNYS